MTMSSALVAAAQSGAPLAPRGWTPSSLSELNFSTDCSLVAGFYSSWFADLTQEDASDVDIYTLKWSDTWPSFYVAQSLDSQAVDSYFRNTLPEDLQSVLTMGQVLDWELSLQRNFSHELERLAGSIPDDQLFRTDWWQREGTKLETDYYRRIIKQPGQACLRQACATFEWNRLSDINGQGVFATYWAQVAGLILASLTAAFKLLFPTTSDTNTSRLASTLYTASREAYTSLSQTVLFFALVAPMAIAFDYVRKGPHWFPPKDQSLALTVVDLELLCTIWLSSLNNAFRLVDARREQQAHGTSRTVKLPALPVLTLLAIIPFWAFLDRVKVLSSARVLHEAFQLDYFVGDFCAAAARGVQFNIILLITRVSYVLVGYGVARVLWTSPLVRVLVLERLLPWRGLRVYSAASTAVVAEITTPSSSSSSGGGGVKRAGGLQTDHHQQLFLSLMTALHDHPARRAEIKLLCVFELCVAVPIALVMMASYTVYRAHITDMMGPREDGPGRQWNFSQLMAVSTLLPGVIAFLGGLSVPRRSRGGLAGWVVREDLLGGQPGERSIFAGFQESARVLAARIIFGRHLRADGASLEA